MSDAHFEVYQDMKKFIDFGPEDAERLKALAPVFAKHGPNITSNFYDSLLAYPKTAAIIEGRVEPLKATHGKWMVALFEGEYDRAFFDRQYIIGDAGGDISPPHVPSHVAGQWNATRLRDEVVAGQGREKDHKKGRSDRRARHGWAHRILSGGPVSLKRHLWFMPSASFVRRSISEAASSRSTPKSLPS